MMYIFLIYFPACLYDSKSLLRGCVKNGQQAVEITQDLVSNITEIRKRKPHPVLDGS